MTRLLFALLFSFAIPFTITCSDSTDDPPAVETITGGQPMLRTIKMRLPDATPLVLEVADDPEERTAGLSGRSALEEGTGMLFVWEDEAQHTLWMKDMLFDLDFVWLDADRTVISINRDVQTQPGAPTSELVQYRPSTPAKYSIELEAGEAEVLGIEAGDVLEFDEGSD